MTNLTSLSPQNIQRMADQRLETAGLKRKKNPQYNEQEYEK